ncbi:hypothetical protein ACRYCC_35390 [Actinomadura scrupuli]|uniref:hypothetical protein n=1 Tax=Actinomadura scrupuli TaxID=559629 RepID=UPI003D972CD9
MVYIVTLAAPELSSIHNRLRAEQRLTKALPKGRTGNGSGSGLPMVLVLSEEGETQRQRRLGWMGVVAQHNIVGAVDRSITIDPLRECMEAVPLDGEEGLLSYMSASLREEFDENSRLGDVGECSHEVWEALEAALRGRHSGLDGLLDWLLAQAAPPMLDSADLADRSWQEQQDATRSLLRIAEFPQSALAAWRRPLSRDAPYLAGLIPQPVEHSLIDHDIRVAGVAFDMFSDWQQAHEIRCDVHVLQDGTGRRLEVANVNATPVEARLGTDMIYYHEPTESFVLVQYKRLDPIHRSIRVDGRLRRQLDRLEDVERMSRSPAKPSEWRMGGDACFLKLAYWPTDSVARPVEGLVPGMYLPLSYVRLLLADDCTRGPRTGSEARILGYKQVERYLVATQFVEMVKYGLVGTVGTTAGDLRRLVERSIDGGQSTVVAVERSQESVGRRQKRTRDRGSKARHYTHQTFSQDTLPGPDSADT